MIAIKKAILAEYEAVLDSLGWRAGLILPRHLGEAQWLMRNGAVGDSLLLSGSSQGFTGVIFRDKHPLFVRTVECGEDEFEDEFYRLLLFYRDRSAPETGEQSGSDAADGYRRGHHETTRRGNRQRNDWR